MRQVSQMCLMVCLSSLLGCGSPALLQCRLNAVESAVPADPGRVTVDDVIAVVHALSACKAPGPDAGGPP